MGALATLALGKMPLGSPTTTVVPAALASMMLAALGATVASRHPRNSVGWLMLGAALSMAAYLVAGFAALQALASGASGRGAAAWFAWTWNWVQLPGLALAIMTFLVFPDGRLLGGRWVPVCWASALGALVVVPLQAMDPAPIRLSSQIPALPNPVGVRAFHGFIAGTGAIGLVWLAPVAAMVVVVASLVIRLQRSTGVERQQVKVVVYVVAITLAVLGVSMIGATAEAVGGQPNPTGLVGRIGNALVQIGFNYMLTMAVPASMAVAILRYRLYDIDRIINRTLVYGLLTAVLVGVYAGLVLGLEAVVGSGNAVVVAGSTLVVAALFNPLRRRLQSGIDRRFYRRRYDATLTLEAFGARLRDQVDLEELTRHLVQTVTRTVEPARASLWLRDR